jgi:MFS superfamily sulfate permease-like transporter
VAEAAGAIIQMTGVVGALAVALLLVVAPDMLQHLPSSALAAVVIASAIGLIKITDVRRIYRIQRWECWLSIVCTIGVVVFGAIEGIGLAIVIAIIEILWDAWRRCARGGLVGWGSDRIALVAAKRKGPQDNPAA